MLKYWEILNIELLEYLYFGMFKMSDIVILEYLDIWIVIYNIVWELWYKNTLIFVIILHFFTTVVRLVILIFQGYRFCPTKDVEPYSFCEIHLTKHGQQPTSGRIPYFVRNISVSILVLSLVWTNICFTKFSDLVQNRLKQSKI